MSPFYYNVNLGLQLTRAHKHILFSILLTILDFIGLQLFHLELYMRVSSFPSLVYFHFINACHRNFIWKFIFMFYEVIFFFIIGNFNRSLGNRKLCHLLSLLSIVHSGNFYFDSSSSQLKLENLLYGIESFRKGIGGFLLYIFRLQNNC